MEIWPDVHWIAGRASNLFLCVDDDGLTLIDAGMPNEQDAVLSAVAGLGHAPADLKRIFITHADIDHAGSAAAIQAATGAAVYAGPQTPELLKTGRSPNHLPRLAQWLVNTFVKYKPLPADCLHVITDGEPLPGSSGLQARATPGHTLDHFSFYSPRRGMLFAGDALNTRDGRLQRTPKRITASEDAANRSAIGLLELNPALIACGHGTPSRGHDMGDVLRLFNELRAA